MPSSQDQSCSLLAISKQHTEEEILPPRDIINERRFCWCKDKFFCWQLLVTKGALNLLEGVGGGGRGTQNFPTWCFGNQRIPFRTQSENKMCFGRDTTQYNVPACLTWRQYAASTLRSFLLHIWAKYSIFLLSLLPIYYHQYILSYLLTPWCRVLP